MTIEQVGCTGDSELERESAEGDDPILRALVGTVVFCLVPVVITIAFWSPVVGFVLIGALGVGLDGLVMIGWSRLVRRDEWLAILAIAVEQGVALPATIEALADSQRGRPRRRLLALARILNQGAPLPEALVAVPNVLPRHATLAIGMGGTSGRLAAALRQAVESPRPDRIIQEEFAPRLIHITLISITMTIISAFIFYFVIPKYEAIFMDFGAPLPRVTVWVIIASHWLTRWGWPLLLGLMIVELAIVVLLPFYLADWLSADVLGVDRLLRSRHRAPLLRALAWVVEGEKPLAVGVSSLVRYYPSRWIQERLALAIQDVGRGSDFWKALRERRLIGAADAALLESAQRVGNLPWALHQAAESAERRTLVRLHAAVAFLSTVAIVALGALVLVLTVAFFVPLVTLIMGLT